MKHLIAGLLLVAQAEAGFGPRLDEQKLSRQSLLSKVSSPAMQPVFRGGSKFQPVVKSKVKGGVKVAAKVWVLWHAPLLAVGLLGGGLLVRSFLVAMGLIGLRRKPLVQRAQTGFLGSLTPQQEQALKQLYGSMDMLLKEAGYPSDTKLWGVPLSQARIRDGDLPPSNQAVLLLKFLRSREFDAQHTYRMLLSILRWRRANNIDKLMTTKFEFPEDVVMGKDADGQPIVMFELGRLSPRRIGQCRDLFVRWRIKSMEQTIGLLDFDHGHEFFVQVLDLKGVKWSFFSLKTKKLISGLAHPLTHYYPDFKEITVFSNVPTFFAAAFKLLKPLIPKPFLRRLKVFRGGIDHILVSRCNTTLTKATGDGGGL